MNVEFGRGSVCANLEAFILSSAATLWVESLVVARTSVSRGDVQRPCQAVPLRDACEVSSLVDMASLEEHDKDGEAPGAVRAMKCDEVFER